MLFRQAGIFHTDYAADRALFPIPADRWMIGILLLLALPHRCIWVSFTSQQLYAAVAGVDRRRARPQSDSRMGRAVPPRLCRRDGHWRLCRGACHQAGIPWEIAIILAGLTAAVDRDRFAFAALRVKGLYLALSTLALQFVMDWTISHVPAISGGTQATLQAPDIRLLGCPSRRMPDCTISRWSGACW